MYSQSLTVLEHTGNCSPAKLRYWHSQKENLNWLTKSLHPQIAPFGDDPIDDASAAPFGDDPVDDAGAGKHCVFPGPGVCSTSAKLTFDTWTKMNPSHSRINRRRPQSARHSGRHLHSSSTKQPNLLPSSSPLSTTTASYADYLP